MNKKIAFLFLTIDNVNFPKIWESYFRGHENKYTIYCHPKNPNDVTIEWMKLNIINNLVPTGWGYIVGAYKNLFTEASKNPDNYKFVTISESCLPLVPFDIFYNKIFNDDIKTSYVKFMKITSYDMGQRIQTNAGYKNYNFIKHYARFCLSRYHVEKILKKTKDFEFFEKMHIGDEFFLTMLNDNNNIQNDHVKDFVITYDNWEYVTKKRNKINKKLKKLYKIMDTTKNKNTYEDTKKIVHELIIFRDDFSRNPKSYTHVTNNDINQAKKLDSFFWRKFPKNSDVERFYNLNNCCLK